MQTIRVLLKNHSPFFFFFRSSVKFRYRLCSGSLSGRTVPTAMVVRANVCAPISAMVIVAFDAYSVSHFYTTFFLPVTWLHVMP